MSVLCPQCGAPVQEGASKCEYCGAAVAQPVQQTPQQTYQQNYQQANTFTERMSWPIKNKIVAALLAILLGGLGIHKFYLGQTGKGILYLIFCWTYIPGILGLIDGIMILCSTDEAFQTKYKCRIG